VKNIDRELVIKWVKRLQDPKSKQAHSVLRDEQGGMCCLGHLCHVYAPGLWRKGLGDWSYLGETTLLPEKIRNLVGLNQYGSLGSDWNLNSFAISHSLVDANDMQRWTLPEIADAVIKKYEITQEELA
jgi:hypothetical protein